MYPYACIYIPIWLDLLFQPPAVYVDRIPNLHSNMVRFIIKIFDFTKAGVV